MLGPVIGPPLGGLITTYLSWRWIFYINVPVSILAIFLAGRYMENFCEPDVPRLDIAGFFLSASGLMLAMFGLTTINDQLMPLSASIGCMVVGSILIIAYVQHARRAPAPLLDLRLLKIKTYGVGISSGSLFRLGVGSLAFMLPMLLQLGFGLSPAQSGTLTCASGIGAVVMKPLAKPVIGFFGFRRLLTWNAIFSALWIASFGLFRATTPHAILFPVLLVAGLFHSLQFTALNVIPYADMPDSNVSQATSLYAMLQQLSLGMGVALGALALQFSAFVQGHRAIGATDFWPAFLLLAVITMVSAISSAGLPANAGAGMAGRRLVEAAEVEID